MAWPRSGLRAATTTALCGLLASCGGIEESPRIPDHLTLEGTELAFSLYPETVESKDWSGNQRPGYLVLVAADGSHRAFTTTALVANGVAWSAGGIFLTGSSENYLVGSGRTITLRQNVDASGQSVFALSGSEYVAVLNNGSTAAGYQNQILRVTKTSDLLYGVEGNYLANANCAGVIYGVSPDPGRHRSLRRVPGKPYLAPEILAQLYPPTNGHERVVGSRAAFAANALSPQIPCVDGKISYVSRYSDASEQRHNSVVTWDTRTGLAEEHPLVDSRGHGINDQSLAGHRTTGGSVRAGTLEWLAADGTVMATRLATGVTLPRFATAAKPGQGAHVGFIATRTTMRFLVHDSARGQDPAYLVYDRASGKLQRQITIKGLGHDIDLTRNIGGFAIPPDSP